MEDEKKAAMAGTPPPPSEGEPKKTFTAEEVERMKTNWSENISRHETAAAKAAKELESIKAKIAKEAEERKLAEMTEVERAKKALADKEQEIATLREATKTTAISAEIKLVGLREGALDVGDLLSFVDRSSLEVAEDGSIKGVEEAIKGLKEKKPYLFKPPSEPEKKPAGQHPPNSASPRKDGSPVVDQQSLTAERIRMNSAARGLAVAG